MIKSTSNRKIPYLRRALSLTDSYFNEAANKLKMVNKKRIHIKKLFIRLLPDEKVALICLKKKLFKNLVQADCGSFSHCYWLHDLKNAKKLVKLHYWHNQNNTITYFNRLNKNLEIVKFVDPREDSNFPYYLNKLSKAVGGLRKLKIYEERRSPNQRNDKEEFQTLHRYLARLPNLENFEFLLYKKTGYGVIRDIMGEEGKTYEKLTRLWVDISPFLVDPLRAKNILFFQFQVFPNLRQLYLKANGRNFSGLGSIPKAFENLPRLERFSLGVSSHLPEINFFFEGLLKLPQLTSFSLQVDFLEPDNWNILIKFMQNQHNLAHLSFQISKCDDTNEEFLLENFFQSLSFRPKLQSLAFRYRENDLLSAFSNGLKRIVGTENVKYFSLEEGLIERKEPVSQEAFEGLCEFLLKNRNTLQELRIEIPLSLGMVLSQLNQLKNLYLFFCEDTSSVNLKFEQILCEKLEDLSIDFRSFQGASQMIDFLNALGSLKNLRNLWFEIPEGNFQASEAEMEMISRALDDLKYAKIIFQNHKDDDDPDLEVDCIREISKVLDKLWREQSFAVNLSF